MVKLKNITNTSVSLQMFNVANPVVNGFSQKAVLTLTPGEVVEERFWVVSDVNDPNYNAETVDNFIRVGILTRIK